MNASVATTSDLIGCPFRVPQEGDVAIGSLRQESQAFATVEAPLQVRVLAITTSVGLETLTAQAKLHVVNFAS